MSVMKKTRGFTLIELMITVAIIAILAAVAYPAYTDQVRKARRADAKASLMEYAQQLERCFTEYNDYDDPNCPGLPTVDYYTVSFTSLGVSTFELQALATGAQADDTKCARFLLDHTNKMTAKDFGGADTTSTCW